MMKPINSKERSKLFWQFFFIFIALCIVPMSMIFYAYYVTPEKISEAEQQKLDNFASFQDKQKTLVKNLVDIDSNITLLTSSNGDPDMLRNKISTSINGLADSNVLIRTISKEYGNYFVVAKSLLTCRIENKKLHDDLQKAQDAVKQMADDKKQQELINSMKQTH